MPEYPTILKRVMKDYRLTQVILAKVMGVGQGVISKYLIGKSIPDAEFMANLAIEFSLNPYVLIQARVKEYYLKVPDPKKYDKYRQPRRPRNNESMVRVGK